MALDSHVYTIENTFFFHLTFALISIRIPLSPSLSYLLVVRY